MENTNHHNQQGGTGNGFLLGLIVGVLLTLLFTTKRGRIILKEVLEKGTAKFSNLEQLMRETEDMDIDEEFEGDNDFTHTEPVEVSEPPKEEKEPVAKVKEEKADQPTKKEILAEEKIEKELSEPEAPKKQEEVKPKTPHGKRWFRLKKKS